MGVQAHAGETLELGRHRGQPAEAAKPRMHAPRTHVLKEGEELCME